MRWRRPSSAGFAAISSATRRTCHSATSGHLERPGPCATVPRPIYPPFWCSQEQEMKFLIKETTVRQGSTLEHVHWYPCKDAADVDGNLAAGERPGFGQDYDRVTYQVYSIEPVLVRSHEPPPVTMLEK